MSKKYMLGHWLSTSLGELTPGMKDWSMDKIVDTNAKNKLLKFSDYLECA